MKSESDDSDDETKSDESDEDEAETNTKVQHRAAPRRGPSPPKGKSTKHSRSKVTLGGLLDVLDGPGAKEGRLVVCTTNSPYSLDEALARPGRIDRRIFLGKSSKLVAAITFSCIFGTDPRLRGKFSKRELNRIAKEFGDVVPNNTFTPCEIQQFCMKWQGKPERAIKEMPQWAKDKLSGAHVSSTTSLDIISEGDEIDTIYKRFYNLSHPDFAGLRNMYPYGKPLKDSDDENEKIVLLEVMDPIPEPPSPHKEDEPTLFEEDFSQKYAAWFGGLFM
ncbi:hypothetical protein P171DRAFT_478362 [Karstenula rhodostoma CBS 690.94]|uniref:ATPase AAA-type core domain-containing protein n=1 Tax=Karstenula rhodostoma CBS 690.94 TaxID=1392251 RepID=A0A9P4PW53_9PLEO|nr:hypothetical protein P171DRAFT_478362 [Karstenula rhodostoma CBS 690.94]